MVIKYGYYFLYFLIVIGSLNNVCYAQNHIPNPGFEDKYACPTGNNQVTTHCKEWYSYTPSTMGTPDYYHICGYPVVPPLKNYLGENYADDSASVGIHMWPSGEYIATKIPPLIKDSLYEVSFSAIVSGVGFAVDGMGAFFFKNFVDTYKSSVPITTAITAQVDYSHYGPIWDSINWKRLKGYFHADSAYDHMVIGQFKDTASITRIRTLTFPRSGTSYTVIDSVVVKKVRNINLEFYDSLLCAGDTVSVGCFVHPYYFSSGNVFTLQLSDGNGSFTNAINIGGTMATQNDTITGVIPPNLRQGNNYRLRIVANAPSYASDDNGFPIKIGPSKPARPIITTNEPVCKGGLLVMSATCTTPGVDWYWMNQYERIISTTSTYSKAVQLKDTGYFRAFASNGGCLSEPDSVYPTIWDYYYPVVLWHFDPGLQVNVGTKVTFYAEPLFVGDNPVYDWYKNGNLIQSTPDSFYTGRFGTDFYKGDEICVKIFSSYKCRLRDYAYRCETGLEDLDVNSLQFGQVKIYPNPVSDVFFIDGVEAGTQIELLDIVGSRLYLGTATTVKEAVNVSKLPSGNYILQLTLQNGQRKISKAVKM